MSQWVFRVFTYGRSIALSCFHAFHILQTLKGPVSTRTPENITGQALNPGRCFLCRSSIFRF